MISVIRLPQRPPFDHEALIASIRAHLIAGAEVLEGSTLLRCVRVGERILPVRITLTDHDIVAESPELSAAERITLTHILRSWFDTDHDPRQVREAFRADPLLSPLAASHPGLRVPGTADGAETAILTILGQQVSLAAARTFSARLVAWCAIPAPPAPWPHAPRWLFPEPAVLAATDPETLRAALGLTRARALTVVMLARALAGGLFLGPGADAHATRAALLALPGIGPWTADYLAVRVLGDRDAFVPSDLVLRRALTERVGDHRVDAREAERLSQAWRPLRAYALTLLWTAAAYAPDSSNATTSRAASTPDSTDPSIHAGHLEQ